MEAQSPDLILQMLQIIRQNNSTIGITFIIPLCVCVNAALFFCFSPVNIWKPFTNLESAVTFTNSHNDYKTQQQP